MAKWKKLLLSDILPTDEEIEEYKKSLCRCYICNTQSDLECRDCEQYVCENCTVEYIQFNQIDYTLCELCYDQRRITRQQYAQ